MAPLAHHPSLSSAASASAGFASSSNPVIAISAAAGWWAAEPIPPWGAPLPPSHPPTPDQHPAADPPPLPPASRSEARSLRDALAGLLSRERAAAADFLLALADFDRRRGPQALGHKGLFTFLTCELHLSNGAAYLRSSAAELLPRYPAVEAALRDGRLCLSAVGELARVLEPENEARFLPRFFGCSAREAREVAAELAPRQDPPRREVVTRLPGAGSTAGVARAAAPASGLARLERSDAPAPAVPELGASSDGALTHPAAVAATADAAGSCGGALLGEGEENGRSGDSLRAHEVGKTHPSRAAPLALEVEPLTGDLRRLHLTVSKRLLAKLARAKDGLAHALPGASTEQVLEAALDLLLEKQDRRKGLVKRPRPLGQPTTHLVAAPAAAPASLSGPSAAAPSEPHSGATSTPPRPSSAARYIPAAVRREVWLRDGQRCQHPLDSGATCGATARLELDHVIPLALGGPSTAGNLRVTCAFHNQAAARAVLGDALVEDQRSRSRRGPAEARRGEHGHQR